MPPPEQTDAPPRPKPDMRLKHLLLATLTALFVLSAPAQVLPQRPKLETPGSFSMILRPNPQGYVKFDTNQPLFELTTGRLRTFSPCSPYRP